MDTHFTKRVTQLKRGLQDIAEVELINAKRSFAAAEEQLQELTTLRRAAQAVRNQSGNGAQWMQWHTYVQSLEARERKQSSACQDAKDYAQLQQRLVQDAYIDVRKWESILDRQTQESQQRTQKTQQALADESAALRYGRGSI